MLFLFDVCFAWPAMIGLCLELRGCRSELLQMLPLPILVLLVLVHVLVIATTFTLIVHIHKVKTEHATPCSNY